MDAPSFRSIAPNRISEFSRTWAMAQIFERNGQLHAAITSYCHAASVAPTPMEEELALTDAWICQWHAEGHERSELEVT